MMAEGSDMSEETKLLQEKLNNFDAETLKELLQTAIANKTKESDESNVVDQTADNATTENEALDNKTSGDDDTESQANLQNGASGQSQIIEDGASEPAVMQSETISDEATRNEMISSPNTLANDIQTLQIQQEPKSQPTPNMSINAASFGYTSLTHQNSPVFTPQGFNQPGNFDGHNTQTEQDLKPAGDYNIQPGNTLPNDQLNLPFNQPSSNFDQPSGFDQKPVTIDAEQQSKLNNPVTLPTTSNPPSTSIDQQNGQQIFLPGKNSPYTPVTLPSNQSPLHLEQQSGAGPKPMVTPTVVYTTQQSLPSGSLPTASQSASSSDQKMGYSPNLIPAEKPLTQATQSMATNNPFSSLTAASTSSNFHQPTRYGMVSPSKERVNHPDKGSPFGQFNAPSKQSPTSFYQRGQSDQKPGMVHSKVHQPNESLPTYQFKPPSTSPSKTPSASFDQNHQSHTIPVVTSSTYDPQDISFHNFPSAVPPLNIPLSKIDEYLPPGVEMDNSETWIPLPLKPVIVVKDQVALMVFERDNGVVKEHCEQQVLLEEQATTKLSIQQQNATYLDQQPPQMLKGQQVQNENQFRQFGPYNETPHQVNHATDWNVGQASAAPSIQQQQPVEDYQQQQQQQKQTQQQQHQRQQIEQQRQQPYDCTPQYEDQQPQNFDRPRFPSTSNPSQCQDPQQQPILSSFPAFTHQDPSRSQQVHRSSSLPHIATATPIQQTNNQQSQQQSNSVPGLQPPIWMSDEHCNSCTNCGKSFSITRRKHHCRGCGKIFCSECCDQLAQLPYLGRKVARICITCTKLIKKAHADRDKRKKEEKSRRHSQSVSEPRRAVNNSLIYIPSENVVSQPRSQPVIPENNFNVPQTTSDAYQTSTSPVGNFNPVKDATLFVPEVSAQPSPSNSDRMSVSARSDSTRGFSQDNGFVGNSWKIPPRPAGRTITWTDYNPNTTLDEQRKRFKNLNKVLKTPEGAVIQAATKLSIVAKKIQVVVKQELHEAWFLCSVGFANCDQEEIAFILEKRIAEDVFPYEMLKVYRTLYSLVLNQGERFVHGNYLSFNNPVLGSKDNAGFLFITLDKAPKLIHHHASRKTVLIGILIKQAELLCTKYVPTRLLNALGAQQQCFPSPALSSRDRPSACNIEPNELFYSTFFAFNQFLNHKIPQAMIPDVHILKSGSKVVLELPFTYQTEVISILDSLLVDESQPVTVPIAGDLVPEANGHFVYTSNNTTSARRGFVVLQNSNEQLETGNQYLAFSAILLVLTFGDACNSRTRFGIEVVEDGITVTFSDSQAKEIRQAIYQGTNCAMSVGTSADSREEFTLRWTSDTCPSILDVPTPIRVVPSVKKPGKGYFPATTAGLSVPRAEAGQTNVIIDRVKTRDIEAAIPRIITSENPQQSVNKLENDVRQACGGCLLTFANRLKFNAEKRINLTLSLGPGNYKKWCLGPNNQPINLARSLQLALKEIDLPDVNGEIVFVFNVILQKKN